MSESLTTVPQAIEVAAHKPKQRSRFLRVTPSYIGIAQAMTSWSPASGLPRPTPGKVRVSDTGQEYDEMQLVILTDPADYTDYQMPGTKVPSRETLLCFSRNLEMNAQGRIIGGTPHAQAKNPQAMACAGCPQSSWEKWRETGSKDDIPGCKPFVHLVVVDRHTKFLYFMDVRATSLDGKLKNGFNQTMRKVAKYMAIEANKTGREPQLYDYTFKVYGEPSSDGKYYTLGFKSIEAIKPEDRATFGAIYEEFVAEQQFNEPTEVAKQTTKLDAELTETPTEGTEQVQGEYVQI